jgi:PAS domain S-box-containing protein
LADQLGLAKKELEASNRSLYEAHAYSRNILRTLADTLVVLTSEGRIRSVNPEFCRLLGFTEDELVGCPFARVVFGNGEFVAGLLVDMKKASIHDLDVCYQRKDGTELPTAFSGAALRDVDGTVSGYVGIARDMTETNRLVEREKRLAAAAAAGAEAEKRAAELQRANEELRETQEQLLQARKMESLGRFVGGIAHDFNNILMAVNAYSELALDQLEEDSPVREDVDAILLNGNRAKALTSQLLTFARKQVQELKVVEVREALEELEDLLVHLAGEGCDCIVECGDDPGRIAVDLSQLEQVLTNLVVNARDAMGASGVVRVRASPRVVLEAETSRYGDIRPGNYVDISVSDTGCGMSPETLANIFEPFFTTKASGKGTGLGLSTVYGIVAQSQGYVRVDSTEGEGTTISCLFPASEAEVAGVTMTNSAQHTAKVGAKILVVEDEPSVRDAVSRIISEAGYATFSVPGGEQAIDLYRQRGREIDLVLTDVGMPSLDGVALFKILRGYDPDLKILLMSGYPDRDLEKLGYVSSMMPLLTKPISREELLGRVSQALGA